MLHRLPFHHLPLLMMLTLPIAVEPGDDWQNDVLQTASWLSRAPWAIQRAPAAQRWLNVAWRMKGLACPTKAAALLDQTTEQSKLDEPSRLGLNSGGKPVRKEPKHVRKISTPVTPKPKPPAPVPPSHRPPASTSPWSNQAILLTPTASRSPSPVPVAPPVVPGWMGTRRKLAPAPEKRYPWTRPREGEKAEPTGPIRPQDRAIVPERLNTTRAAETAPVSQAVFEKLPVRRSEPGLPLMQGSRRSADMAERRKSFGGLSYLFQDARSLRPPTPKMHRPRDKEKDTTESYTRRSKSCAAPAMLNMTSLSGRNRAATFEDEPEDQDDQEPEDEDENVLSVAAHLQRRRPASHGAQGTVFGPRTSSNATSQMEPHRGSHTSRASRILSTAQDRCSSGAAQDRRRSSLAPAEHRRSSAAMAQLQAVQQMEQNGETRAQTRSSAPEVALRHSVHPGGDYHRPKSVVQPRTSIGLGRLALTSMAARDEMVGWEAEEEEAEGHGFDPSSPHPASPEQNKPDSDLETWQANLLPRATPVSGRRAKLEGLAPLAPLTVNDESPREATASQAVVWSPRTTRQAMLAHEMGGSVRQALIQLKLSEQGWGSRLSPPPLRKVAQGSDARALPVPRKREANI